MEKQNKEKTSSLASLAYRSIVKEEILQMKSRIGCTVRRRIYGSERTFYRIYICRGNYIKEVIKEENLVLM